MTSRLAVLTGLCVVSLVTALVLLNAVPRSAGRSSSPAQAAAVPFAAPGVDGPLVTVRAAPLPTETPRLKGDAPGGGAPVRISMPRLGVDSVVLPVSGQSGVLEPPPNPQELGWWQEGAPVGSARGTTVMTGHTVHTGGGALDHLRDLQAGDRVFVRTPTGRVRYEVRSAWVLSKLELAERAVDLFAQDRPGRLVLVTCYDYDGSEYLSNAVVAAVPTGSRRL